MTPVDLPSPNFGLRRNGALPDLVVLHYTAMARVRDALDRLRDPAAQVSAHYLIGADGTVWLLVDEAQRAWHAGAGAWGAVCDVNSRSIGIELDNAGDCPFSEPLMASLEALLPDILTRWSIPPARVIAHSDMAPDRKCDPGPRFDWRRLARGGLSVWPKAATPGDFATDAARFGYCLPQGNDADGSILKAFRARFRPWADGPLDDTDRALAADLAARFPVDHGAPAA